MARTPSSLREAYHVSDPVLDLAKRGVNGGSMDLPRATWKCFKEPNWGKRAVLRFSLARIISGDDAVGAGVAVAGLEDEVNGVEAEFVLANAVTGGAELPSNTPCV